MIQATCLLNHLQCIMDSNYALLSICMNTIKTAAYAALAATTSNGLFTVAVDMSVVKSVKKRVIIRSLVVLFETHSSHHIGPNNMPSPSKVILQVVNLARASSLA
jgi:hypothetical protein